MGVLERMYKGLNYYCTDSEFTEVLASALEDSLAADKAQKDGIFMREYFPDNAIDNAILRLKEVLDG